MCFPSIEIRTGSITEYAYDDNNRVIQEGDITYSYDINGNLLSTTDPTGQTTTYGYDDNENQTTTTYSVTTGAGPETVSLTRIYDKLNRVVEQVDADGLSTLIRYDAAGRQTGTRDAYGNWSETEYDARGLRIRSVYPDGREEVNVYDEAGRLTSTSDERGRTTTYLYDEADNVTKITQPNGTYVTYEYDKLNRRVKTTTSKGLTTGRVYDDAGRVSQETDTLGLTTRYEYYPDGTRWKVIDPRNNVTEYIYDANGQLTEMRLPDGTVSYVYNEIGKKIAETDQRQHTTEFEWDAGGRLRKITDPLSHETVYAYNETGNLISQTDANTHTTLFEYNKAGKRTKKTYPLGMFRTTSYDVLNRTTTVTDFNGDTITRQYDTLGHLRSVTFPIRPLSAWEGSGVGSETISYTYGPSGQVETVTGSRGATRFEYDDQDRLEKRTDPDGTAITYTEACPERSRRDTCCARITSVTVGSRTTEYEYDDYDRLTLVRDPDGNEITYTYDAYGNRASISFPNGPSTSLRTGVTTEYGYDTQNRLTSVTHRDITNAVIAAFSYTLNAKGQRERVVEQPANRTIDYRYDELDRLIEEKIAASDGSVHTISYTYDPVGNRLTKNDNGVITEYSYDANDRLLTENGYIYMYDNNGNMLSKAGSGAQMNLTYNALNQLTHAEIATAQDSSTVDYMYDHDGIRIRKTLNGMDVINYIVDKNRPYAQVLEERDDTGSLRTRYLYGHDLLAQTSGTATNYYHYDGLSSTRLLSDMSGNVTDTYTYDAYGLLLDSTGSTSNPYLYRGEQYDPDLRAYYLRARYYQMGIGRFMTVDTFEGSQDDPLSLHKYLYAHANPVTYIDPSGNMSLTEALVVTSIVVGLSGCAITPHETSESSPRRRALTPGEITLAREIFDGKIKYSKVEIRRERFWGIIPIFKDEAMAPNGNIYFHPEHRFYHDDFSTAPILHQGYFIHEMTHVWQYQIGVHLKLKKIYQWEYDYELDPQKPLLDYKIEQQAQIVMDYFFRRRGFITPHLKSQSFNLNNTIELYEAVIGDTFGGFPTE